MYRTITEIHEGRKQVANPSWGVILLFGIGVVVLPLAIEVVASYPAFGVGLGAGLILPSLVRAAPGLGRRLLRNPEKDPQ